MNRLEEIRQREEKATPGPWMEKETDEYAEIHNTDTWGKQFQPIAIVASSSYDTDFIAHAREDIPWLLERIGQLEERVEDLREDFVDYACSGVPNLAPYCKNKTAQCVDGRGWCNNTLGICKGFLPQAWHSCETEDVT